MGKVPHKIDLAIPLTFNAVSPLISIVMPVRNAEKYLQECLQSIIEQGMQDWELVVVDDGSTDSSFSILQNYAQQDQRIKLIRQNPLGIIPALSAAYAACRGDWISRMDADDIMHPQKLEQLWNTAQQYGPGHLMIAQVEYFRAEGIGEGYRKYADWLNGLGSGAGRWAEIYKECVIPSPGWLAHRSDLDRVGAFAASTYPEDYDLSFRFLQANLNPIYVGGALHYWRDYSERSSRNDPNYTDNSFLEIKMAYFLKLSLDHSQQLVLWGSGKKGKSIAKKLIAAGINFQWITNNDNKIGRDIYSIKLEAEFTLESEFYNKQFIVAIANPEIQLDISKTFKSKNLSLGKEYFFFA